VNEHLQNLLITYTYPFMAMWIEPGLLITGFFGFFILVIGLMRINLSIGDRGIHVVLDKEMKKKVETIIKKFLEWDKLGDDIDGIILEIVEKKKSEKEWEKKIKELNDLKTQIKKLINKLKGNHQTLAREFIEIRKERGNIDDKWKNFYNLIIAFKVKQGEVNHAVYEKDYELYRNEIVSMTIQFNDRLADLEYLIK